MKTLCSYHGGSYSYGLNTPQSDIDERFVFIHDEASKILGLERFEHLSRQDETVDSFGWELRHYLSLLNKGNTMCLEILYNNIWTSCTDEFKYIQSFKHQLIDSHKLFKCLRGYCQSERSLVLGERTGVLGGKRKSHLDMYGYSFKNAVQFLRLCLAGEIFFKTGEFPVNIRPFDTTDIIFNIKTMPEKFTLNDIKELMTQYELKLENSYNNIQIIRTYDMAIANNICYNLYMPILIKLT